MRSVRAVHLATVVSALIACSSEPSPGDLGTSDGTNATSSGASAVVSTGEGDGAGSSKAGAGGGGDGGRGGDGAEGGGSAAGGHGGEGGDDGTGLGPGTLHTLTVTLASHREDRAAMDALPLELCLNESECFPLRRTPRRGPRQAESGALDFDVHAIEGLAIPHEAIDRYELRTMASSSVTPACMSLRFDGEPTFCSRSFENPLGTGAWDTPQDASTCFGCWDRGTDVDLRITHGPFVGALRADAGKALIWARADAAMPVELVVSTSPDMSGSRIADAQTPSEDDDFTVRLEATGLVAGQRYHYQLRADGALHAPVSDTLHANGVFDFVMPPEADVPTRVRFALGSCARAFEHEIFDSLRSQAPELLLMLGDYHYGNVLHGHGYDLPGDNPEDDDPFLAGVALDDFRWFYRTAHGERAGMLADVPMVATWDDHDYGGTFKTAHGESPGRRYSRRAWLEYFANPNRTANPDDEGTYFRKRHGNVELFVLDARTHRPRLAGPDFVSAVDPSADPLGAAQTNWLIQGLSASTAPFKIVAAGTKWSGRSNKSWGPFREARDALLERIVDAGIEGVVLASGGPHSTQHVVFDAAGRTWHEIVASPLSSGTGDCEPNPNNEDLPEACTAVHNFVIAEADDTLANASLTFEVFDKMGNPVPFDGEPYLAVLSSTDLD